VHILTADLSPNLSCRQRTLMLKLARLCNSGLNWLFTACVDAVSKRHNPPRPSDPKAGQSHFPPQRHCRCNPSCGWQCFLWSYRDLEPCRQCPIDRTGWTQKRGRPAAIKIVLLGSAGNVLSETIVTAGKSGGRDRKFPNRKVIENNRVRLAGGGGRASTATHGIEAALVTAEHTLVVERLVLYLWYS